MDAGKSLPDAVSETFLMEWCDTDREALSFPDLGLFVVREHA